MLVLTGILMLAFVGAMVLQVFGLVGMVRFYFKRPPRLNRDLPLPTLSIVKPCHGIDDGEESNFESFYDQKYTGKVEILYVVDNESAPVVPIVRAAIDRNKGHPTIQSHLVFVDAEGPRKAAWGKADALMTAHRKAQHEIIVWSDSDTVVTRDYFEQLAASFQDPKIHVVTVPQYEFGPDSFATALKVAGNYADCAVYCMGIESLQKEKAVGWGHSLAFRKGDYEQHRAEIEEKLVRTFADDQVLPRVLASHGKFTTFKNVSCPVRYSRKSLEQVFVQKERWAQCQKGYFPNDWLYLFGVLSYPEVPAFLLLLLSGFAPLHLVMLLMASGLRTLIAFFFEVLFLESFHVARRWAWVVPVWDLLQIYFFINAFMAKTMRFHGVEYRIKDRIYLEKIGP